MSSVRPLPKEAHEFLETQRVGVLAVRMPDGSPHAATVHFAYVSESPRFIFLTSPAYKKVEPLRAGPSPASFVIGTSEEIMKTLQMDGIAALDDTEAVREAYFGKFPDKKEKHPEDVFITFTPAWWRYTDWTLPQGKTIFASEEGAGA